MGRRARQRDRVRGVAALLLLGVLSIDAWFLPSRGSWVGQAMSVRTRRTPRIVHFVMIHDGARWNGDDASDIGADFVEGEPPMFFARFSRGVRAEGVWAPVVETRWAEISFRDNQGEPGEPPPEVRAAAAAYVASSEPMLATHAAAVVNGNQQTSRLLWGGVLHTLVALFIFAAAMWLMPWRRLWRYLDNQPEPVDPDACDHCDYNLAGLDADRCPECGTPLPEASAANDAHPA